MQRKKNWCITAVTWKASSRANNPRATSQIPLPVSSGLCSLLKPGGDWMWSNKHITPHRQRSRACVRVCPCVRERFWRRFTCLTQLALNFLIGLVWLIRPPWRLQMVTVTEWNQHPVKIWLGGDLAPVKQIMVVGAGGTRNEWAESFLPHHHRCQCQQQQPDISSVIHKQCSQRKVCVREQWEQKHFKGRKNREMLCPKHGSNVNLQMQDLNCWLRIGWSADSFPSLLFSTRQNHSMK